MEMASQPVIMSQPQRYTSTRSFEWQTDLCDCGSDCRTCLCGVFCFCCLGCKIAKDMEECCCCGPSVAMRTRYRTQFRIPGSICSDCLTVVCCAPCNLCQLKRDINRRKQLGIF
ncbi:PREDICTED: placenta-specific gene 8 protein-like [Gekko japonicus]|uniref:Placenta-specific gene 8 protein-like n=1 Tax=Gekko japonicus TaxID=146911 RepID=A0ABM1KI77_GEKJA|nr:PREDICTED: placenta-specific gene 8 protein-like [Gekko japonicus]